MNNKYNLTKLEIEVKKLSSKTLEKLTQDEFKPNKKDTKLLIRLSFLEAEKDKLKNKELQEMLNRVSVCMILELLDRKGLLKRNKKGFYDKTKLGRKVNKMIQKDALEKNDEVKE